MLKYFISYVVNFVLIYKAFKNVKWSIHNPVLRIQVLRSSTTQEGKYKLIKFGRKRDRR